ncbi:MAG: hypothetical protein M3332_12040 [Actinomycetota bacterium]|nr:hypothetical protein [Actinomycetota bacterium]
MSIAATTAWSGALPPLLASAVYGAAYRQRRSDARTVLSAELPVMIVTAILGH